MILFKSCIEIFIPAFRDGGKNINGEIFSGFFIKAIFSPVLKRDYF